jgi:sugar phosphate isomerase/epimerase
MLRLGITTRSLHFNNWMNELNALKYKTIEVQKKSLKFYLQPEWINKLRIPLKDLDLSMHSGTKRIFTNNTQFTKTELEMLKSEITICSILGIKELIFHLKDDELTNKEADIIKNVILMARKKGINLIYESNSTMKGHVALDTLNRIPYLSYNLDLGHLNLAIQKDILGMKLEDFIRIIKSKITYIHIHNNNGVYDQHKGLSEGTLDWKGVLDLIDLTNVKKIISETNSLDIDKKNILSLKRYLKKREIPFKI